MLRLPLSATYVMEKSWLMRAYCIAAVASKRGVQLRAVRASLEADMDVAGILGIDGDVRNGFSAVRVTYTIDADAPRREIEGIVAESQKRSAVLDIITNPTAVTVRVA